jgi:hypothetical protein
MFSFYQNCVPVRDLCKKWNSICSSIHKQPYSSEKTLTFSSLSPSSSTTGFSQSCGGHHHFWNISETSNINIVEPRLRMYINTEEKDPKQPFSSNPNSDSSGDVMETDQYTHRFKELNAENHKSLCNALEKKVPWQKDIIPEIAETILKCRSGMVRRNNDVAKEETWLFFQGVDVEAKEKIARELAKLVFGSSQNNLISISLSSFSSTRADSIEDCRNKRSRNEQSCSYIERFAEAVSNNPHRVFLVEDVEQADYCSQMGFKRAIERGSVTKSDGEEVDLSDSIIILSCESFSSRSRACSPPTKQKSDQEEKATSPNCSMSLDLNICINDDDSADDQSIDDIGLLDSVDKRIIFKYQEL